MGNDMDAIRDEKRALRARVGMAVRALTPGERVGAGPSVRDAVLELTTATGATVVAAFRSLDGEPDTEPLIAALQARGLRVLLPVMRPDSDLDWRVFDGRLETGPRGTRQPPGDAVAARLAEADVVLVPARAVDPAGGRLGRGGGSYDRALGAVRRGAVIVAVVHDVAVVDAVPVDPHDRAVDVIVTPTRVINVGGDPT